MGMVLRHRKSFWSSAHPLVSKDKRTLLSLTPAQVHPTQAEMTQLPREIRAQSGRTREAGGDENPTLVAKEHSSYHAQQPPHVPITQYTLNERPLSVAVIIATQKGVITRASDINVYLSGL